MARPCYEMLPKEGESTAAPGDTTSFLPGYPEKPPQSRTTALGSSEDVGLSQAGEPGHQTHSGGCLPHHNSDDMRAAGLPIPTAFQRLGRSTCGALVLSSALVFAVVGFLTFLWYAGEDDITWHRIMVSNWAVRAITISALVLRLAIDVQAGVATMMLAGVTLESYLVHLPDAAVVSTARSGNTQPRQLLLPIVRGLRPGPLQFRAVALCGAVALLTTTTLLLQFSSTVLVSDLALGRLPSMPFTNGTSYDLKYQPQGWNGTLVGGWSTWKQVTFPIQRRTTTWSRKPNTFPAFGEFHQASHDVPQGVDDTGFLLRAFLPFADVQSREMLKTYVGKTRVLDARVACQRPELSDLSLQYTAETGVIGGSFEPSETLPNLYTPSQPVFFSCKFLLLDGAATICQLQRTHANGTGLGIGNFAGGLLSAFTNVTAPSNGGQGFEVQPSIETSEHAPTWGTPFLVIDSISPAPPARINDTLWSGNPWGFTPDWNETKNAPWLHDRAPWIDISSPKLLVNFSMSLCYTAWDTATLNVSLSSQQSRTEPTEHWSPTEGYFTVPDATEQLGPNGESSGVSAEQRGILQLLPQTSWIPEEADVVPIQVEPLVQIASDMSGLWQSNGSEAANLGGNYSTLLDPGAGPGTSGAVFAGSSKDIELDPSVLRGDQTFAALYRQTLARTGSLAYALSALLTLVSSMAYYDQMPQYQQESNATQTFFQTVLLPQRHTGFAATMCVIAVHLLLVLGVALAFVKSSRYTLLGNLWQDIAQLQSPEVHEQLLTGSLKSDAEVRRELEAVAGGDMRVGVRPIGKENRVALTLRDDDAERDD